MIFTCFISFTPFTGCIGQITPFLKSQPISFKFSGITLDDMRNHYKAFYENLLVRILLKSVFVEKNAFFTKNHLSGDISQKPNFLNAILFLNIKPLSITRFYKTFQKFLLISIFLRKLFRCKNVFF